MHAATPLRISSFGPLTFDVGAGPIGLRGKPAALLALLACFPGEVVSRSLVTDALWDRAAPPPDADRAIRQVRRRLADLVPAAVVTATGSGLRLEGADVEVDVFTCRRLLRSDDPEALRRGLAMWTADPFPEVAHVPAVQVAVNTLAAARLDAIETLVACRLQADVAYPLVADLERLVALYPHRERLWCQLAVALHECDRRVDALRALARYKAANPGIAPSARLARVEQALVLDQLDRAG